MKTDNRTRLIVALALNAAIVALELVGAVMCFVEQGLSTLQFYTQDSNFLALFSCAALAVCQVKALREPKYAIPKWAAVCKYVSVCCLMVTFLVVLFVLAPMNGGFKGFSYMFFSGTMLYQHLLCPLLAFVSFAFFERASALPKSSVRIALAPTALYAVVLIILNAARVLEGPYPFLMVYEQPLWMSALWCALILGGAWLVAWGLYKKATHSSMNKP